MDLGAAGLRSQPFPTHGKPRRIIPYRAQQEALSRLRETLQHPTGLSLLQGPSLAGKSILLRSFIDTLSDENAVAIVNGKGLNTTDLLLGILRQFGYDIDLSSANELLGLLRVFALQQATKHLPPLLVIENAHAMNPSALRALCELAALRSREGSALKIVLVGNQSLSPILQSPAMQPVALRLLHDIHLRPLERDEAVTYVHEKLGAAGAGYPSFIFSERTCEEIWRASGGWPGIVDRIALLALAKADCLPVSGDLVEHPALPSGTWNVGANASELPLADTPAQPPRLVVSSNAGVINDFTMERTRLLIGRAEHNDIAIDSRFISRHHVLLVRHGHTTVLMDLNSTNGTSVNSKRVSNHVLLHDDVITIGHHKIKFQDPFALQRTELDGEEFADTAIMKTLDDMRELLARENTALLPAASEHLPTVKT